MTKENVVTLPPQYHDLLIESGKRVGLNLHQISIALKTLVSKTEHPSSDYDLLVKLFKAISEREFPFIVLVSGDENMNLKSVDLLPDPQLVNIVSNRQKVSHVFSRLDPNYDIKMTGFRDNFQIAEIIKGTVLAHLNEHSKQPFDTVPYTIAIGNTQNPSPPHLDNSLSFGFPYKEKIKQIQMGLVRKSR